MSTKNIPYLLLVIIALTLAACAPAAAIDPTHTPVPPTATPIPHTVTAPPTTTPTATATAIPATPEYDGELTYNPADQTLYNAQAMPVFVMDESGGWVAMAGEAELPAEIQVIDGVVYQWDGSEYSKQVTDLRGRKVEADFVVQTEKGFVAIERDDNGVERAKVWINPESGEAKLFKPGSVAEVDGQWYRYVEGEMVEWDIWEPGFSIDLVGTIDEQAGKEPIVIPFSLGLMPDIMERDELPIIEIYQNPDRPDGPDKLARMFLRTCWYNYNREHEDGQVNWDQYLDMVRDGEGKYKVVVVNPEDQTWNGVIPKTLEIIEKSPLDGFAIYNADGFYNRDRESSFGEIVTMNDDGELVILRAHGDPRWLHKYAEKNGNQLVGYGYYYSLLGLPLYNVNILKTIDDALDCGGYANYAQSGRVQLTAEAREEYYAYENDMINNGPYFLVGTK
ncbi:MAG: hypothetical protein KKD28_06965 [Chloroflexi bacterium]|nr:hypothetical protein [Chloroflexota bacterium]MBU1661197.1 hypothetical protein [Chloroflexota bacterium]